MWMKDVPTTLTVTSGTWEIIFTEVCATLAPTGDIACFFFFQSLGSLGLSSSVLIIIEEKMLVDLGTWWPISSVLYDSLWGTLNLFHVVE